jgi:hypothetical protein
MQIIEVATCAALTFSITGISYSALNPADLREHAQVVAYQADCQAVDVAIAGYLAVNNATPGAVADLQPYVRGDISAYRLVDGLAAGPGCAR